MTKHITCPILKGLVEAGIRVQLDTEGYRVFGFYKSDSILLIPNAEYDSGLPVYVSKDRYGGQDSIRTLKDMVFLNSIWLQRTSERDGGGVYPNSEWEPLLLEHGYLKKEIQKVTRYTFGP